ncbi:neprilysin-2-like isoform X2 [Contarinia nasturtii]|uniref:neprilysin-2-like isoform X2 n=1 Tax=Contarinia nasturtii TaxID=265458 RepID=UPI0012D38354|nr:neprilysin-2-like isoform X2 [Contarinia nasturtii]XP_031626237.1 neprilysin-2-like isoform X2 [Contarinia nasturtii]
MVRSMDFDRHRHGIPEKKRHSCFVRTLIILNIFFIIAIALSIAVIYRFAALIKEYKSTSVCHDTGCVSAAADVLRYMDASVEPCVDFYDFACGKFLSETTLTDEKVTIDTFNQARDKMQSQLLRLIDAPIVPDDLQSFRFIKLLYSLCMNQTQIEETGLKSMIEIHNLLGGWPVVVGDQWNPNSTWNWEKSSNDLLKAGFGHAYLFVISIDTDMRNSSRRRIVFDEPTLGLSREFLLQGTNDSVVQAYYDYMTDLAVIFGADRENAKQELLDVLEFEKNLANISMPMEQRRNSSELYNPLTFKEIQTKYPYLNWVEYINNLFPSHIKVNDNETVILNSLSFFKNFGTLLETTPNRTIANYLFWRLTEYSAYYLNSEIRKRQLLYNTVTIGKKELSARWKECISLTNNKLSTAVGALYIREYFHPVAKETAASMVEQIRKEFKDVLKKNEWMDAKTKLAANNKVDAIVTHIGYPDELYDDKKLEEYHKTIEINSTNYLASILNINKFYMNYELDSLRKVVNKTDWISHSSPTFINAFYSFEENSIELPAGILGGMFFASDRPLYMNFGGIGFIIGHELTHGFDDEGRQYDQHGDLLNWWDNATEVHFLQRAQCMIEQYSNFTEPLTNLSINGINTQGENIADNGGLKFAYNAYKKWIKKNGSERRLPGLQQYTPEQMFWIASAQTWCSIDRTEYMRLRILNGVHAPDKYRVIGSISNSDEFSQDFQCKPGQPMNPVKKCTVW